MTAISSTRYTPSFFSPALAILVPILAIVLYLNILDNPPHLDGLDVAFNNPQVISIQGPLGGWAAAWTQAFPQNNQDAGRWRPMQVWLYRLEYKMWGPSPSSFHSANLILFVTSIILFLLIVGLLIPSGLARTLAVMTFALHPMASQSLQTINGQGILLALAATLAAFYWGLCYRRGWFGFGSTSAILFVLTLVACTAHELGLWALLAWGLLAIERLQSVEDLTAKPIQKKTTQQAQASWPLWQRQIAVALLAGLILAAYVTGRWMALDGLLPSAKVSQNALLEAGQTGRLNLGPTLLSFYLWRLVWPAHPSLFFSVRYEPDLLVPAAVGWLILAAVLGLIALSAVRRRWTITVGLGALVLPLICLSGWLPLATLFSENVMVFMLPGLCLALGGVSHLLLPTANDMNSLRPAGWGVLIVFCGVWCAMAWQGWQRSRAWKSTSALWEAEAKLHPLHPSPLIHQMEEFVRQQDLGQALQTAQQAEKLAEGADIDMIVELKTELYSSLKDNEQLEALLESELDRPQPHRQGHYAKLAIAAKLAKLDLLAEDLWRREVELFPTSYGAMRDLAQAYYDRRQLKEALDMGRQAVLATPAGRKAPVLELYGLIASDVGMQQEAIGALNDAINNDPTIYRAYIKLIQIYWGAKQYKEAKSVIAACLRRSHVTSYVDLAKMLTGIYEDEGKLAQALDEMMIWADRYHADPQLILYVAAYQLKHRQYEKARLLLQGLVSMQGPQRADVFTGLGIIALNADHNKDLAIKFWEQALQINPQHPDARRLLNRNKDAQQTP